MENEISLPPIPAGYAPEVCAALRNYARAAIEAYQRQQWRPIDTAPTNGQPVLLFARLITATASTRVVGAFIDGEWLAQHYSGDRPVLVPSHWMPLPDFPGCSHA